MTELNLAQILKADLATAGMTQRELVDKLNDFAEDKTVTETAISNWKKQNFIPPRRVEHVLQVLGSNSLLSQAVADGRFSGSDLKGRRLTTLADFRDETFPPELHKPWLTGQGAISQADAEARFKHLDQQAAIITAMLENIPVAQRDAAFTAIVKVLVPFALRGPATTPLHIPAQADKPGA